MAIVPYSLAGMVCNAVGTSDLTLTTALPGFASLADIGVPNGTEVRYLVKDGNNRELGVGAYNSGSVLIPRTTVVRSISSGAVGTSKISLSGASEVYLTIADSDLADLMAFSQAGTLPSADGTAGQVLTTDGAGAWTWETASSGGGLIPISKATASASSAINIALSGGYSAYLIRGRGVYPATNGAYLYLRTSTDGASYDSGSTDYDWKTQAAGVGYASTGDNSIRIDAEGNNRGIENTATGSADFEIWISPADGTYYTKVRWQIDKENDNFSAYDQIVGSGRRKSTTAVTHVRFVCDTGNITAGTFHLYGIAEGDA